MEYKVRKEPVYLSEVIYDGQTEQGVEFDYVLPDYYPDIFKILKCTLTPCVVSYSVSGSQLFCDGVVYIKVLYLSEANSRINCIEQRYTYSKTVDLVKTPENPVVTISPKTDYCNCRAVSGRRIDVRGAVSCKVKVTSTRTAEMISGVEGEGIETKKSSLGYCGEKLTASHQFVCREDIESGAGKEGTTSIIHHDSCVTVSDYKVIANKVVIKAEAQIKALYITQRGEAPEDTDTEVMEAVIPISQIIDMEGVTERHVCFVDLVIMDSSLDVRPSDAGENRIFASDLTLGCTISAHLESNISLLADLYSTEYESSFNTDMIKVEALPQILAQQLSLKHSVECAEGVLEAIYDTRCFITNMSAKVKNTQELSITGHANIQTIGRLDSGMPVFIDKSEPFELSVEAACAGAEYNISTNLQITHVTYSISSDNHIDLRINLQFSACMYEVYSVRILRDIAVNEDKPKEKSTEFALKLYYAEESEEIWGIAKRYNTSADAIITENDLESDRVQTPCMLLIPIV